MRNYELTVIGETEKAAEAVAEILKKAKVKILKETKAEKKVLAYEIAKNREGYYIYWEISLEPADVSELDKKLKLQDKVIRYLLCRADL